MKLFLSTFGLVCLILTVPAHAVPDAKRYANWLGEVEYSQENGNALRSVCRVKDASFYVCFFIGDVAGLDMDVAVGLEEGYQGTMLSTEHWPSLVIDGKRISTPDSPSHKDVDAYKLKDKHGAYWKIVTREKGWAVSGEFDWKGTQPTFDLLMKGENLAVTLFMEDGTATEFGWSMQGLREILLALMPDCCRNPE